MNKTINQSRGLTALVVIATFVYILTSSIAFPVLCKEFYYAQIGNLHIVERSGLSREQIETAYSEVVDYCIGARKDFAVGGLDYSEAGKQHFEDCRVLFILDLALLVISIAVLVAWVVIKRKGRVKCAGILGHGPGFWGAALELITFAVIGGLGSIDFDKTFVVFHSIFFPGKDNWIFDYRVDPVIKILPEEFFMRCAIVIVALILIQSLIIMIFDIFQRNAHQSRAVGRNLQ